jgi:hypothetical protein
MERVFADIDADHGDCGHRDLPTPCLRSC